METKYSVKLHTWYGIAELQELYIPITARH